ncbi:MAG: DUF5676 family membrane protein [bacterium]|nr:DUF5676 family membrane protein [bacterium]
MKITPFANSLALASVVFYLACALLAIVVSDFLLGMFQSWLHGINVTQLATTQRSFGSFLFGLISLAVVAWIFGYVLAWFYEKWSK